MESPRRMPTTTNRLQYQMEDDMDRTEQAAEARVWCSVVLTRDRIAKLEAREKRRLANPQGHSDWPRAYAEMIRLALVDAYGTLLKLENDPS